jgi:hypothetical protein
MFCLVQVGGLSMRVDTTQNLPIVPVQKISTSLGKSRYSNSLEWRDQNQDSKRPILAVSQPAQRSIRFERGSLVDLYA